MGNTHASGIPCMAIGAVAKRMHLTKHQVILLHEAMTSRAKGGNVPGSIKRKHFHRALDDADIVDEPDREILNLLFTMWDLNGTRRVPSHEFVVGLTPLACGGESISTVLAFALQIKDRSGTGRIPPSEMLVLLKSINATASYFGDAVLGLRQIYQVVDNVYDTISVVNKEESYLNHQEAIRRLVKQPSVKLIITKEGTLDLVLSDLDVKSQPSERDNESSCSVGSGVKRPYVDTSFSSATSEGSSVGLSPIARVSVEETDSSGESDKSKQRIRASAE